MRYEQWLANERRNIREFMLDDSTVVNVTDLLEGVDPPGSVVGSRWQAANRAEFVQLDSGGPLPAHTQIDPRFVQLPPSQTFDARSSLLLGVAGASTLNRSSNNAVHGSAT